MPLTAKQIEEIRKKYNVGINTTTNKKDTGISKAQEKINSLREEPSVFEQKGLATTETPTEETEEKPGLMDKLKTAGKYIFGGTQALGVGAKGEKAQELATGVAKTGLEYIKGGATLGEKMLRSAAKTILPKEAETAVGIEEKQFTPAAEQLIPESATEATTGYEKAGKVVGEIAAFLAPSTKVAKLEKGLSVLPRALTEATAIGGQTAIKEGGIDNKAKTAAIVGAMFPIVGTGLKATKGLLKPVGEKIQATVIKPQSRDLADGFKIENLKKYDLGGTLEETVTKTHTKLNELSQQLQETLEAGTTAIDLKKVAKDTLAELSKGKGKTFGNIQAVNRVLKDLGKEIKEVSDNGIVDLVEATNIKRGAGTKGAWAFGRVEPDASAVETVYSTFYNKLKTEIEKNAPEGVKEINKQISELIPISNAALRRLPVEQRNNVISLTDSIGLFSSIFDPRALALIGANKLSKSGKFGSFLVDVATKIKQRGSVGKRIFGE